MTELTREKVSLTMLAIRALRLTGKLDPNAPVSTERMARISAEIGCPVSEKTFRTVAEVQLAAVRRALLSPRPNNKPTMEEP